jgi:uncharacterized phage protein (TIGR01671 family)
MKEIKFRAWDKANKQMYQVKTLTWDRWGRYAEGQDEIMQYTGLKAKGKEVYEGDILSYSEHYIGDHCYSEGVGVVEFDNGGFFIKAPSLTPALCREEIENEQMEIIGNIYENPELIK